MKWRLILLLVVSTTCLSVGQSLTLQPGPVFDPGEVQKQVDLPKGSSLIPSSAANSTSLFFDPLVKRTYLGLGFLNKAFYFGVLDNYLTYSGVKTLTGQHIHEDAQLNGFFVLNKKRYVLYSVKYPKLDQFTVYMNELGADVALSGSPIILHQFKELKNYGMNVSVSASADNKNILIARILEARSKENQKLECKLINETLSEVWLKRIETEVIGKEHKVQSIKVDNQGNLYALIEVQNGKSPKPLVYAYFRGSGSVKKFEPGQPTGLNFGTRLELVNGKEPYLIGLNEDRKEVKYYINRINTQAEMLEKLGLGAMPEDFRKSSNVNIFETSQWSVMHVVSTGDDMIVASIEALLLEAKYGVQHSYNAFVFAFRKDGSAIWSRTIQKKQSTMPGMAGHVLIPAKNGVLVVYNDDAQNISKNPDDANVALFNSDHAMAVVQAIGPNGKATKYPLTTNKEFEGFALNFNSWGTVETDLYFDTAIKIDSRSAISARNATLRMSR